MIYKTLKLTSYFTVTLQIASNKNLFIKSMLSYSYLRIFIPKMGVVVWTKSKLALSLRHMTWTFYSIYGIINSLNHWCWHHFGQSLHMCTCSKMQMTLENFMWVPPITISSPDILPMEDQRTVLRHIESQPPSTMYLPISSDDTLHFYQYLNTHVLIAGQFLLLINVSIQNIAQQLQIYVVFSLPVLHSKLSSQYKINHTYIGVTYNESKAVAIMDQQYKACQHAKGQFCRINAPFQPLTNPPSCITALYAKNDQAMGEQCSLLISYVPHTFMPVAVTSNLWIIPSNSQMLGPAITIICPDKATSTVPFQQPFHILRLSPAWSVTSRYFHLPQITRNTLWWQTSLWIPQILMQLTSQPQTSGYGSISTVTGPHFHLQKWTTLPEVPVAQLYTYMIDISEPVHSFTINKDDDKDPSFIWTILMHPGTYIGTIRMIFTVCIGVYCFKRICFRSATPRHWSYFPVSSWHAIADNNVEIAPISKSEGTFKEPRRPHMNNDLHIEWEATRLESHCNQPVLSKGVPITGLLAPEAKI